VCIDPHQTGFVGKGSVINNNNNKQAFQNAQLTLQINCHKGARSNYTGTVWNKAVFRQFSKVQVAQMSRHVIPGSPTRRTEGTQSKAGHAWPVVPAVCLHQKNVTEDGQERRSLMCRSATGIVGCQTVQTIGGVWF